MSNLTIKDIAKICGVGVSTVSRALNNHSDINPKTRDEILKVVEEQNFVPNSNARNLKKTEPKLIALLIRGGDNPFYFSMVQQFERMLTKLNFAFVLQQVAYKEDEVEVAQEFLHNQKLEGIIFLGGRVRSDYEPFRQLQVPYVLCAVGQREGAQPVNSVSVDNIKESEAAVDYLCGLGHKKIAILVADTGMPDVGELRLEGYRRALEKRGIPIEESFICPVRLETRGLPVETGYRETKKLLEKRTDFSAIFVTSDLIAIGAYRALMESGKRIPKDCSLIGFDGLEMLRFFYPSITSVKQPKGRLVKETIELLLEAMDGGECECSRTFEASLEVRESTGPCPAV